MEAYYYLISAHNSDNNSPEPLYHLGFLYEYGLGVSLDSFTAIKYYE
jgi:TPR repeat protein